MNGRDRCFACDRPIKGTLHTAITSDGQSVRVGIECALKIHRANDRGGYQPPKGGPFLFAFPAQKVTR
jgi:hypothetical protein